MIPDLWYKNATIYCLDVETFQDGNDDGVGDFIGLRDRLDYLAGLGVNCLWLLPFYATPNRDNGYDVSDYCAVDPRLGDLGDFVAFSREARMHGIRVLVDLVANHTSNEHPWFLAARGDPGARERDYYVWSTDKPADADIGMEFPGAEKSTWTWDDAAKAYYFHRFFSFQPDLNVGNPAVRRELMKIVGFWLELGVSGFRVDAVPFLVQGHGGRGGPDPFVLLDEMREFLSWRSGDAVLLAEANVPLEDALAYFGDGDRMQLVFDFLLNQHVFLALADEDAAPIARVLREAPALHYTSQRAQFLRNHDELDLRRLTDAERGRVFARFGPEPSMQVFGRGLRRRLAPMLGGDERAILLAHSLLLSLPGTPVLWFGEEIGMGEDLALDGRQSVRTPMQWSAGPNAGFTRSRSPVKPLISEGRFSFERVNTAAQRGDPDSLLNAIERLVRLRKESPEIGWGHPQVLETGTRSVLGVRYDWNGGSVVLLHNLGARPETITLRLEPAIGHFVDVTPHRGGHERVAASEPLPLAPFGFRWLRPDLPEGARAPASARE